MQALPGAPDPWNSLEIAKLLVGVLTPLSVAALGFLISSRLKRLDLAQWKSQKLLEKRIAVYDQVAPQLNLLLCFYTWVGYWRSITPDSVIQAKRELDRTMNVYRYLFQDEVYMAYQAFVNVLFETYTGAGHDAKILSAIRTPDGDRISNATFAWQPEWSGRFTVGGKVATKSEVRSKYQHLMAKLTESFGVVHRDA
jgi:hypothetical protein